MPQTQRPQTNDSSDVKMMPEWWRDLTSWQSGNLSSNKYVVTCDQRYTYTCTILQYVCIYIYTYMYYYTIYTIYAYNKYILYHQYMIAERQANTFAPRCSTSSLSLGDGRDRERRGPGAYGKSWEIPGKIWENHIGSLGSADFFDFFHVKKWKTV